LYDVMALNEEYSFHDVRYQINSRLSYDVELSFGGIPDKVLLDTGTVLARLDFPVVFGLFSRVWWMREPALQAIVNSADPGAAELRRAWQHQQAMPKASKGTRTQIIEIALTAPVYAWIGIASPLFHKQGGAEQVYLPNLAKGAGPDRSNFARLLRTSTLHAA
jgi:hypothetical protein